MSIATRKSLRGFFYAGCTALVLATVSGNALADEKSHAASAEKFLQLVQADQLTTPLYMQVQRMFAEGFDYSKAPDSKRAVLERYQSRAKAVLDKNIGWSKIKPNMVRLYTQTFTEQELTDLIKFYESPLGKKMMQQLPELNRKAAETTQKSLQTAGTEIDKLMDQMLKELGVQSPKQGQQAPNR